jgi:hypothetical protein
VLEVIDFIRQFNRILEIFHVDILQGLDAKLAEIERRIREPFVWIEARLTELQNWVNRIITLDGLLQRATLIASMARHAPPWISGFWNSQINAAELANRTAAIPTEFPPLPPSEPGEELGRIYRDEPSGFDEDVAGALAFWREAAGLDAPGTTAV